MTTTGHALSRLATSVLVVFMSTVLVFVVLRVLPGDPVLTRLGAAAQVDPATLDRLRRDAGLDDPIVVQYLSWLGGVLHGDLGESYFSQLPVTHLIGQRLPATFELTVFAILLAVVIAVPLALLAARRPGSWLDRTISGGSSFGMAVPPFVLGLLLILVFSVSLKWFPGRGFVPVSESVYFNLRTMVLPSVTLALVAAPLLVRYLRAAMVEVASEPFVRTAEGKGAPALRVLTQHVARTALLPALTVLGLIVGYTLGGVVVIEYVFGLPGIGALAIESALKRDYSVLQGVVLVIVVMFTLTTLAVDLLYGLVDPRLKRRSRRG